MYRSPAFQPVRACPAHLRPGGRGLIDALGSRRNWLLCFRRTAVRSSVCYTCNLHRRLGCRIFTACALLLSRLSRSKHGHGRRFRRSGSPAGSSAISVGTAASSLVQLAAAWQSATSPVATGSIASAMSAASSDSWVGSCTVCTTATASSVTSSPVDGFIS